MRINSAADVGATIRTLRAQAGLTQIMLARQAGVSRRWLSDVESGKESAELGLVLRTLRSLNTYVDVRPEPVAPIDLDALLERHRDPADDRQ